MWVPQWQKLDLHPCLDDDLYGTKTRVRDWVRDGDGKALALQAQGLTQFNPKKPRKRSGEGWSLVIPGLVRQRQEDAWGLLGCPEFQDTERPCLKNTRWTVPKEWHCRGCPLASMCTHRVVTSASEFVTFIFAV